MIVYNREVKLSLGLGQCLKEIELKFVRMQRSEIGKRVGEREVEEKRSRGKVLYIIK